MIPSAGKPGWETTETLVDRVSDARKRKLAQMVENFQAEPNDAEAHQQWEEIEKVVFGVEFRDWSVPHIGWKTCHEPCGSIWRIEPGFGSLRRKT